MVLRCAIHLENEPTFYTAGDIVSGFVVLSTTWSDKLYGITVKLASKVEVDWDASRLFNPYRTSRSEDVSFHSDCQILMTRDGEQSCLSNLVSKRTIMITRGVTHRYPFLLKLPKDIPCTFSGTFGYISYKLVVFIRKPFREMYIGATKMIQIAGILDLNEQTCHYQLPVEEDRRINLRDDGGQINMKIRLQKSAFVPEQPVNFTVDVDNRSNRNVTGVKVLLNGNTYFQIQQSWKLDMTTLIRLEGPPIQPNCREVWSHSFECPHVLPSGLGSGVCHAIDVQYFLSFELQLSDSMQLHAAFKLVFGTVPYVHRNLAHLTPHPTTRDFLVPERLDIRRSSAPPAYDFEMETEFEKHRNETPPPTYEEALSMTFTGIKAFREEYTKTARRKRLDFCRNTNVLI